VNGKPQPPFPESERYYRFNAPPNTYLDKEKLAEMNINIREDQGDKLMNEGVTLVNITNKEKASLNLPAGYTITELIQPVDKLFPHYDTAVKWSPDNYGPLWIPAKGAKIDLTPENITRYQRCIEVYEGNKFENRGGQVFINGQPSGTYTFKMDYYFMMGDNRHNSLDSRYWGFVPVDHVVGKASLIWFSWEGGPRWKRIFNSIK
jgi:signal peptidase I